MAIKKPTETQITLRKLLETCRDSNKAFQAAETAVEDGQLKSELSSWAEEREQFCTQLTNLMAMLDTDPLFYQLEEGSIGGFLQRAWMHINSAVSSSDESAIITACETGEVWSRKAYEAAVESDLPDKVREVVEKQLVAVSRVQTQLEEFRVRSTEGQP